MELQQVKTFGGTAVEDAYRTQAKRAGLHGGASGAPSSCAPPALGRVGRSSRVCRRSRAGGTPRALDPRCSAHWRERPGVANAVLGWGGGCDAAQLAHPGIGRGPRCARDRPDRRARSVAVGRCRRVDAARVRMPELRYGLAGGRASPGSAPVRHQPGTGGRSRPRRWRKCTGWPRRRPAGVRRPQKPCSKSVRSVSRRYRHDRGRSHAQAVARAASSRRCVPATRRQLRRLACTLRFDSNADSNLRGRFRPNAPPGDQ